MSMDLGASDELILARREQRKRLKKLRARDRLRPCLDAYDEILLNLKGAGTDRPEAAAMNYLTDVFRGTYKEVLTQIEDSGKTGIGATNSIKRSAGTNFQGLCEYAVLKYLLTINLPICVGPNAPGSLKDELTIYGEDADGGEFSVEPDIDICLWREHGGPGDPIIFLSAKTSLVDRAGQAARWKLYLDLHQTTCTYTKQVHDCPINRTRVRIKTLHPITHCIVTANIYKMDTTQPEGELRSGQCRNNTYMFRHKFTTRNDAREHRPTGWLQFSHFTDLILAVFAPHASPPGVAPS